MHSNTKWNQEGFQSGEGFDILLYLQAYKLACLLHGCWDKPQTSGFRHEELFYYSPQQK